MADRLSIYNGALRLLGAAQLSALTEVGPARRALDQAWRPAGDFLLSKGLWNWAIRSVEMTADADVDVGFGYDNAFPKPADYVRTVSFSPDGGFYEGSANFETEGSYWLANDDAMFVRYISSDDAYGWNVAAWTPAFSKAMEAYLAYECGLPISNDRGNRNDLFSLYKGLLKDAKTLDAVDERVKTRPAGRLVRARAGYRSLRHY